MAFDPDHPTFYGACLEVYRAHVIAGIEEHPPNTGSTADVIRFQFNDTNWAGFKPGARALIGFYPERGLLTLDDDVEFFAVVELREDSTGTFRLSAGVDPGWALTDPALASEPLGTHSAVGAFTEGGRSQVVVPVSSYTGAMIYAGDVEPVLLFEALTGLPKIMQVRVRMWPKTGPAGAWETDPDYALENVEPRFLVSQGSADMAAADPVRQELGSSGPEKHTPGPGTWGGFDDLGDTPGAFSDMVAFLMAHGIPRYQAFTAGGTALDGTVSGSFTFNWTQHALGVPSHDWSGRYTSGMVIIVADPVTAFSRQGGGSFYDPDRVPNEAAAAVRDGRSGGTLLSKFSGWTAYPELSPEGGPNDRKVGVRTVVFSAEPAWTEAESGVDSSGAGIRYYYTGLGLDSANGGPPAPFATLVNLPDAPVVAVEVNGTTAGAMDNYEFGHIIGVGDTAVGNRGVDYAPVRCLQRYENVQFYNPGAATKNRKPRFYVTFTEVDDDPRDVSHVVGIGKPASDTSIFRVPTPLGTLRELRHGEKVSDVSVAYPLKVKLEDGSWTVVAGMTPDA